MSPGVYECWISDLSAWVKVFDRAVSMAHGTTEHYRLGPAVPVFAKAFERAGLSYLFLIFDENTIRDLTLCFEFDRCIRRWHKSVKFPS
jgi:hypothetical protein